MIKFNKEKVMLLHRLLIEQTGGEEGMTGKVTNMQ